MTVRDTPTAWRQGFSLYRRRQGTDSLGNETAWYDMDAPDAVISAEEGLDFQYPRAWNTSGHVGTAGASVAEMGETSGGVLEGYLKGELELAAFDRLEVDGALWEVRAIRRWPEHRELLLQRIK